MLLVNAVLPATLVGTLAQFRQVSQFLVYSPGAVFCSHWDSEERVAALGHGWDWHHPSRRDFPLQGEGKVVE